MTFANPLLLLILVPFGFLCLFWHEKKFLGYSSLFCVKEPAGFRKTVARLNKPVFLGAVFFAVVAIAHPQTRYYQEETTLHGREIVLAVDTSFSMTGTAIETIKKDRRGFHKKSGQMISSVLPSSAQMPPSLLCPRWKPNCWRNLWSVYRLLR